MVSVICIDIALHIKFWLFLLLTLLPSAGRLGKLPLSRRMLLSFVEMSYGLNTPSKTFVMLLFPKLSFV